MRPEVPEAGGAARTAIAAGPSAESASAPAAVGFWTAFRFWLKLGCINFGGPTGQIAVMHQELVERRRWISEERFLHALSYCMLLPGPEAQQLAIYIGWLLHRTAGGLAAGIFFVLPGSLFMLLLSWIYAAHGRLAPVQAAFYGLRSAVIAIVAAALLRIAARALRGNLHRGLAAAAFVALFFLGAPFPVVVLGAGALGWWVARRPAGERQVPADSLEKVPAESSAGAGQAGAKQVPAASLEGVPAASLEGVPAASLAGRTAYPSWRRVARVLVLGLLLWWGPLLGLAALRGSDDVLTREALFFSKAAMVTFGGAYSVLAYIQQEAVHRYGWLLPGQMVDGLALAETTPGPLILVTQFVGYLGAYRHPGALAPATAGALGAAVTVWATFAPCFLWIFLGAPYIERLRRERRLAAALAAITAAVVGVILSLAVWLTLHSLFHQVGEIALWGAHLPWPDPRSLDLVALALATAIFVGLRRWSWPIPWVVAGAAAVGLLLHVLGLR
jgi:chromate transporter